VVPIELTDAEVRGAIEAARNAGLGRRGPGIRSEDTARVLLVPRLGDRGLAGVGTLSVIEQTGRMPGGEPAAVVRGVARVRIGSGTTGPGTALWVEGTELEETGDGPGAQELAKEYKSLVISVLQQRGAWQIVDMIKDITDTAPVTPAT
jgi:ATP-dependent Lon protease